MEQTYAGKQIRRDSKPPFAVSFPSGLMFSKLRSSIAGGYAWRANQAQNNPAEKQRCPVRPTSPFAPARISRDCSLRHHERSDFRFRFGDTNAA